MSKAVLIHNPAAGKAETFDAVRRLAELHNCEVHSPQDVSDLPAILRATSDREIKRVIVAGGDGTIGKVANALLPDFSNLELGIIPLGTANDMARSLDLPLTDLDAAFEMAVNGSTTAIDVIHAYNGVSSYFVNAATGGFGGEVTAALSNKNKHLWGPFSYWMTAMAKLVDLHAFELRIEVDGEPSQHRVYGIGLANGRFVGGGFPIAGSALLNDGLLDLVVIPELPPLELLGAGVSFVMGSQSDAATIVTKRARRVVVQASPGMSFSLDGEPTHAFDASFEVMPATLRVVAGEKAALIVSQNGTV